MFVVPFHSLAVCLLSALITLTLIVIGLPVQQLLAVTAAHAHDRHPTMANSLDLADRLRVMLVPMWCRMRRLVLLEPSPAVADHGLAGNSNGGAGGGVVEAGSGDEGEWLSMHRHQQPHGQTRASPLAQRYPAISTIRLIAVLLLSSLYSIAVFFAAGVAACFWTFSAVLGDPDGHAAHEPDAEAEMKRPGSGGCDGSDSQSRDGPMAVLAVWRWWEVWLDWVVKQR